MKIQSIVKDLAWCMTGVQREGAPVDEGTWNLAGTCHGECSEDDISGWGMVGGQACCRAGPGGRGLVFCFEEFGRVSKNGEPVKQSSGWLGTQTMSCESVVQAVRTVWTGNRAVGTEGTEAMGK